VLRTIGEHEQQLGQGSRRTLLIVQHELTDTLTEGGATGFYGGEDLVPLLAQDPCGATDLSRLPGAFWALECDEAAIRHGAA
jgi:hypothetical protein